MTRPLRIDVAGGWYHVTTRGTERRVIFPDDGAYTHYLELLEEWTARFAVNVHAYVLMPNHVHLVVETPGANLSTAMQWLNTSYAMWFNRRAGRVGPLFQGRFKAILFDGRSEAWAVTRYVHLNPVRVKGLELAKGRSKAESIGTARGDAGAAGASGANPARVPWSSYGAYAGWKRAPKWLKVETVLAGAGGARWPASESLSRVCGGVLGPDAAGKSIATSGGGAAAGRVGVAGGDTRETYGTSGGTNGLSAIDPAGLGTGAGCGGACKRRKVEQFRERHGDWEGIWRCT
jgi:REP element-mobilizing transposase RayT